MGIKLQVEITGQLEQVYNAIANGNDLSYQDLANSSGVPIARAHYYARALQDMGLVEIVDGRKRSTWARKWIRLKT